MRPRTVLLLLMLSLNVACGGSGSTGVSADVSAVGTELPAPSAGTPSLPPGGTTTAEGRLVQRTDIVYLGAFATPANTAWTGRAMAAYRRPGSGALSLFYRGHDQVSDQIAEIEVPSTFSASQSYSQLPASRFIQAWGRLTDGELDRQPGSIGDAAGNGAFVYGLLVQEGRIIVAATTYYSTSQNASHGVSSTNLSDTTDFRGFYRFAGPNSTFPRAMGGAMTPIPPEWQAQFGGTVLAGNAPVSVIGANSFGPAMSVISTANLGTSEPLVANTLVFYPETAPLCGSLGCERDLNNTYTWMSGYSGRAFVPGTRSILAIGMHPTGEMWYGGPTSPKGTQAFCDDGGWGQKAAGMEARILAFDAMDLLEVKNGRRRPWEVRPYGVWRIPEIEAASCWDIMSVAFEPESRLIFVAVRRFDDRNSFGMNRIEVYRIGR